MLLSAIRCRNVLLLCFGGFLKNIVNCRTYVGQKSDLSCIYNRSVLRRSHLLERLFWIPSVYYIHIIYINIWKQSRVPHITLSTSTILCVVSRKYTNTTIKYVCECVSVAAPRVSRPLEKSCSPKNALHSD